MEAQEEKKTHTISNTTAFLMVLTALIFDAISIVPVIGQIIAIIGSAVVFGIWFVTLGLPLISPRKLLTTAVSYLGEAVPAVSALPLITVGVILMTVFSRLEEKTGINLAGRISPKGVTAGVRQLGKDARRLKNIGKTRAAMERLERMRANKTEKPSTMTSPETSRPEMKDFNYPKAA